MILPILQIDEAKILQTGTHLKWSALKTDQSTPVAI